MERGIVSLNNFELEALHSMAIQQGCQKEDLIVKLQPVVGVSDQLQEHAVQISEDEAEIMLDCMPMPTGDTDPNLSAARIKIQQFIAQCRFGDEG